VRFRAQAPRNAWTVTVPTRVSTGRCQRETWPACGDGVTGQSLREPPPEGTVERRALEERRKFARPCGKAVFTLTNIPLAGAKELRCR
jgi:hypothetical protein